MSMSDTIVFSEQVVKESNLERRLHRFLDPVFDWSRKENVAVWVVSASAKWMVEIGVAMFGIPSDHVIGMMPVVQNGFVMPELAGVPTYGPNKPMLLQKACPQSVLLGAFGDSSYDAALLQMAKVPVAVRPKPGLIACAKDIPNLVAIGV
jgi:phosphoserine phosphatase